MKFLLLYVILGLFIFSFVRCNENLKYQNFEHFSTETISKVIDYTGETKELLRE